MCPGLVQTLSPSYKNKLVKGASLFCSHIFNFYFSFFCRQQQQLLRSRSAMALVSKPSSSSDPLDETKPWKIKVKLMRIWKEGLSKRAGNSIDMVLLESLESRIHTTIDKAFSEWIKDINDGDHADIDIPENASPIECHDPIEEIVSQVYGDSFPKQSSYCRDTVILCHTQSDVDQINAYMLSQLPGKEILSHCDDCLVPVDEDTPSPVDYMLIISSMFSSVTVPGVPNQILRLKVGAPIMLLADVDPSRGLCTGTRLQILQLGDSMLVARVATSQRSPRPQELLIEKMHMFSGKGFFTPMRRTQYPFTLAFAMTIDQSRGQTFSKVGLYLPKQVVFPPGQRYLAISKVKAATGLTQVLITEEGEKPQVEAENVVLKKLF
ncbi:DNA helicase Pif1-like [Arabidopsis thaliana x Arabidopsis arenosa]|uniref:DNA helicase Pif1-like n=1 Tax=Arabidopsis thaliana x Arabidopsis arenosa TaxID=1240361 RepID=A0A8T1ZQR6_9BRAS|nr:DNA helicase Pif1-like [Arabidopsis thaliana x Arabidopsis arenosa]